jgi:hypothetical protein
VEVDAGPVLEQHSLLLSNRARILREVTLMPFLASAAFARVAQANVTGVTAVSGPASQTPAARTVHKIGLTSTQARRESVGRLEAAVE